MKIKKVRACWVYVLECGDGSYYTGWTNDLAKRVRAHQSGKGGKLVKRSVKESQELDERIIDEVDFFQASKNWVKGKGFKTNREVIYDRVNKNYAAMQKHQEAETM